MMLDTIKAKVVAWLVGAQPYDFIEPIDGKTCEHCRFFADHRASEGDDWANGYCCHPDHRDRRKSEHYEYGGHWTNHAESCGWWEAKG